MSDDLVIYDQEPVPEPEPGIETPVPETEPEPIPEPDHEDDGEDTLAEDATPEAKAEHKRKGGYQRKLEKERSAREEAQAQAAYYRGLVEGRTPQQEPAKAQETGKPTIEQFETYDEYNEALTDWKVEEKLKARDAQNEGKQVEIAWKNAETIAKTKYSDYTDVADIRKLAPTEAMATAILQMPDAGTDVLYWLGKHPEENERIKALSPMATAIALGEIKAGLVKPPEKPKPTSQAPRPPEPMKASAAIATPKNDRGYEVY